MRKLVFIFVIVHCTLIIPSTRDCLSQWVHVNNGMGNQNVYALAYSGNYLFAGTLDGVYKSTNNGTTWTQTPLNYPTVLSLAVNGNNIFAGRYYGYPNWVGGVYLSTNNGTSWTQTSLMYETVLSLAVNGNYLFAGVSSRGVYFSTNNGTNWTQTPLNNRIVYSLLVSGNNIFAGTDNYGVYLSTNNGTDWTQTSLNNRTVRSLTINGNYIFAGTVFYNPDTIPHGVYSSTNNGTNWTQTSLNKQDVFSLAVNGNYVFAGTRQYGAYVSNNNGVSWTQRNEGLGNTEVRAFCILNNYIFAGTYASVYRRPLGELTLIQPISNHIPSQYSLSQNYPNPFNPVTKIRFDISGASVAQTFLSVYDILGREVATLVNEQLQPGTYEVDFDGSNLPSGIYFYKLTSDDFSQTKKMLIIK